MGSYDCMHLVSPAEQKWFASFGYPNWVTKICVPPHELDRKRFLDVGCGPDSSVATYVLESGGDYWGVDAREEVLNQLDQSLLKRFGQVQDRFKMFNALAENLDFCPYGFVDFVHMRFVLRHLDPSLRETALQQAAQVCRKGGLIIPIELDWSNMNTKHEPSAELFNRFREASFSFMFVMQVDPYLGACLNPLIETALSERNYNLRVHKFHRPEGALGHELVSLGRMLAGIASNYSEALHFQDVFLALADEIEARGKDFHFEPPDIYAAIIQMG